MARMTTLPLDSSGDTELEAAFGHFMSTLGMVPNSLLTMQRVPAIAKATIQFNRAVFAPDGRVDLGLKRLIGHMVSAAAGCQYCKAHTAVSATRAGIDEQKMAAVWEYETSPLFNDRERTALDFAFAAGQVPNAVDDNTYAALASHWDEEEIVEILGVICMFGVFNRWNDSLATTLEDNAVEIAQPLLEDSGWHVGKHA